MEQKRKLFELFEKSYDIEKDTGLIPWISDYWSSEWWPLVVQMRLNYETLMSYPREGGTDEEYVPGDRDIFRFIGNHIYETPSDEDDTSFARLLLQCMSGSRLQISEGYYEFPGWEKFYYVDRDDIEFSDYDFHLLGEYNKKPLSYYFQDYPGNAEAIEVRWSGEVRKEEIISTFPNHKIKFTEDPDIPQGDLILIFIMTIEEVKDGKVIRTIKDIF